MNLFEHRFNMVLEADAAPVPASDTLATEPQ